jgi:hypothetical protein
MRWRKEDFKGVGMKKFPTCQRCRKCEIRRAHGDHHSDSDDE